MHIKSYLCLFICLLTCLFAQANNKNSFSYGIFLYTVNKFVIIATGDSTVSITSIDRSTKTHPLLSNDTLVIPNTFIHNGYEYQVEGIEDNAFIGCKDITLDYQRRYRLYRRKRVFVLHRTPIHPYTQYYRLYRKCGFPLMSKLTNHRSA